MGLGLKEEGNEITVEHKARWSTRPLIGKVVSDCVVWKRAIDLGDGWRVVMDG